MSQLEHDPGCPQDRTESHEAEGTHGSTFRVQRCFDCPARVVEPIHLPPPLVPGTPEHNLAWRHDPQRIWAQLTPQERTAPLLNPLHPQASTRAPADQPPIEVALQQSRLRRRDRRWMDRRG